MSFIRERRSGRFCDSQDSFQKLPSDGYSHTFIYKYVKELVSCNFSKIRELLQDELNRNFLYREKWNIAETNYAEKKNLFPSSLPEECYIALIAYTLDRLCDKNDKSRNEKTALYEDFNWKCRQLRSVDDWKTFPYKSLYALLARSIHDIHNNPRINQSVYYRGMSFTPYKPSFKAGDIIYPTQFLSCSIHKPVAESFLCGPEPTLIKFKGSPLAACGILEYSVFPKEAEILVFPWSTFKIEKMKRSSSRNKIILESVGIFDGDLPYSGQYSNKGININNFVTGEFRIFSLTEFSSVSFYS
ncbi:ecto-ADP-ribosyltransferase 5-like [Tenebrio molitor]|uniref:ecto-ADP-ribosyltransferase 5-like n=1 Tax=Tenebrio molitor TaxID=7067 RepID=UPI00362474C2